MFLLGPSHHFYSKHCLLSPAEEYATPLGELVARNCHAGAHASKTQMAGGASFAASGGAVSWAAPMMRPVPSSVPPTSSPE